MPFCGKIEFKARLNEDGADDDCGSMMRLHVTSPMCTGFVHVSIETAKKLSEDIQLHLTKQERENYLEDHDYGQGSLAFPY